MKGKAIIAVVGLLVTAMLACSPGEFIYDRSGLGDAAADEAMEIQEQMKAEAQEGGEPEGEPTATPTPVVTNTQSPATAACQASVSDPEGDVFNRDTGEAIDRSGADLLELVARCQDSTLAIETLLASPTAASGDYYSFASVVSVLSPEGQTLYKMLLQYHNRQWTRSIEDASTGVPVNWDYEIQMQQQDDQSVVRYKVPREQLFQDPPLEAAAEIFFQGASDGAFVGDRLDGVLVLDPANLPDNP